MFAPKPTPGALPVKRKWLQACAGWESRQTDGMTTYSRRAMLGTLAGAGVAFPHILRAAAPKAKITDTRVISLRPNHYHGWSTLARRKDGELLLVCSGGRESHVCPFGQVELMRSKDCLLYTSPSPRDGLLSRMPSSA